MLTDKIYSIIRRYSGLLRPSVTNNKDRFYINLFDDGDESWQIELTFAMANKIIELLKDGEIDEYGFWSIVLTELLFKHEINVNDDMPECKITDNFNDMSSCSSYCNNTLIEKICSDGHPVLFITGESKSGKTTLIKQRYRNAGTGYGQRIHNYLLDFNGGFYNITNFLSDIVRSGNNIEILHIILDNLECCGINTATAIYKFFKNFIRKIDKTGTRLIVVQDSSMRLEAERKDNEITVTREDTEKIICEQINQSSHISGGNLPWLYDERGSYLQSVNIKDLAENPDILRLLFKVALLAENEIYVRVPLDRKQKRDLILKDLGLKIFDDNKISFYPSKISRKILNEFKSSWEESGFQKAFSGKSFEDAVKKTFSDYYNGEISITNFYRLLNSTLGEYQGESKEHGYMLDFSMLLEKANDLLIGIEEELFNGGMFGNHLGSVLFAAEALAVYANDDWRAMIAWEKIADYVRNTYYVDGRNLPSIFRGKENKDKTYIDFYNGENKNSIKNQILLQDEILARVNDGRIIEQNSLDSVSDDMFMYYLSEIQSRYASEINIEKFFKTYILAILFEFEVTAPISQRNNEMINKLWNTIKSQIIYDEKSGCAFMYPARVPWVSARMVLALQEALKRNIIADTESLFEFKRNLSKYLELCALRYRVENTDYCVWAPGTGQWNGVFETSIMCTMAILSDHESEITKCGLNYINSQKEKWFDPKCIADGIWAYETDVTAHLISMTVLVQASQLWKKLEPLQLSLNKAEAIKKNDKSLGNTHIAKTLICLVNKFIQKKPDIMSFVEKSPMFYGSKRIFISYNTETGAPIAHAVWTAIKSLQNEKIVPFNYQRNMGVGNWHDRLQMEIKRSDYYVLIVSKNALTSKNVLDEINDMRKFGRVNRIIPVIYDCNDTEEITKMKEKIENNEIPRDDELIQLIEQLLDEEQINRVVINNGAYNESIENVINKIIQEENVG